MTVTEIIALCHAGYNSDQIMQLAQAQQMERAQQMQQPVQPVQQPVQPVQQPVQQPLQQPVQAVQPVQQPQQPQQMQQPQPSGYEQIMSELLGLKQAVQAGNMMQTQQPAQIMTADDIIANIIAPKPKKED